MKPIYLIVICWVTSFEAYSMHANLNETMLLERKKPKTNTVPHGIHMDQEIKGLKKDIAGTRKAIAKINKKLDTLENKQELHDNLPLINSGMIAAIIVLIFSLKIGR